MSDLCPACKRSPCPCPVCNGSGHARYRGFSTDCDHCNAVPRMRMEAELAAADKVVEAADALRKQVGTDAVYLPETERYDAARAALAAAERGQ